MDNQNEALTVLANLATVVDLQKQSIQDLTICVKALALRITQIEKEVEDLKVIMSANDAVNP